MLPNVSEVRKATYAIKRQMEEKADATARHKVVNDIIPIVSKEILRVQNVGRFECSIGKNMMTEREQIVLTSLLIEAGYTVNNKDAGKITISWAK